MGYLTLPDPSYSSTAATSHNVRFQFQPAIRNAVLGYFTAKSRANSASDAPATPDGPFAIQGLLSSIQATPAMSRWIHGVSPTNSFRNMAAVTAPPQRPPLLTMSDLIISRYSSSTGRRHIFSPDFCSDLLKLS